MSNKIKAKRGGKPGVKLWLFREQGAVTCKYECTDENSVYWVDRNHEVRKSKYFELFDIVEDDDEKVESPVVSGHSTSKLEVMDCGQQFKPFEKVLVRNSKECSWKCDIFSHYNEDSIENHYFCVGGLYSFCIPYSGNEGKVNKITD